MLSHYPSVQPGHSLVGYEPQWVCPSLIRKFDLGSADQRRIVAGLVAEMPNGIWAALDIQAALDAIASVLHDEWLTVYAGGAMQIQIGPTAWHIVNFYSDLIPLGLALASLRDLAGYDALVHKLQIRTPQRLSALLECWAAAAYKIAGYEVELEPAIASGKCPDFRVRFQESWVYGECKRELVFASTYFLKAGAFAQAVLRQIDEVALPIPDGRRADVFLYGPRPPIGVVQVIINTLGGLIADQRYGVWTPVGHHRVSVCLNPYGMAITTPPGYTSMASSTVSDKAGPLRDPTRTRARVLLPCYGNKEVQKVRKIIVEAARQLPHDARSIIFLEIDHTASMVSVVQGKLGLPGYQHVGGALLTGNGAWFVPGHGAKIDRAFASIPANGPPRMLPRLL